MKNFYKPIIIFAVIISIGIITGFSINHRDIKPSGSNHKVDQKSDNTIDNISNRDEDNSLNAFKENSTFKGLNLFADTCSFDFTDQISGTTNQLLTVSTVSATVAWAAGVGPTVIRTIDGSTWTNSTGTGITGDVYNIYGIDANNALCTTSPTSTFIYKTSNGGATWSQVFTQTGGFIDAIQMTSPTDGYALGDPVTSKWTVLKTSDGGNSWARMATEPTQVGSEAGWNNCFQIIGTNMWFGTNSTKVYHSSNSGLTWSSSATTGSVNTYSLNFNSLTNGLAGGTAMVKTSDGGNSYSSTGSPGVSGNINGLEGSGNFWWSIRSDASVYRSSNQGANWSTSYTRPGAVFQDIDFYVIDPCPKGWIVGDSGKVSKMSSTSITVIENDCGVVVDERGMQVYLVDSIPKSPKAFVKNFGTLNQTNVPVTFKLNGPINYTSTKLVNVNSGDSVQVSFDSTFNPLDSGTYSVTIYTGLATDQNRSNDTVRGITAAYKPNGGYGNIECRYYYANSIAEAKYESKPKYCWQNPTCYFPLITNGVDVSGGRYVGTPDLNEGYFKVKLRNLLFNCGADTSLKLKMCGLCFDSLIIGTNGVVGLTLKSFGGVSNETLIRTGAPSTLNYPKYSVFPLWMNLIFKPGSSLTYGIIGKRLIITYSKVSDFANQTKSVSFQVTYELVNCPSATDPNIRFTYGNIPSQTTAGFNFGGAGAPFVGISATNYLSYKMPFNRPLMYLNNGLAVEFGPSNFTLDKNGCDPCICDGNILQNGNFANYVIGSNSNLFPVGTRHADPWYAGYGSPQLGITGGCCDSGYVQFWGEKQTGERVYQDVNISKNHRYQISMCIRRTPGQPLTEIYGRIGVIFSNGPVTSWIPNTNRYNGRIIGGAMPGEGLNANTTPTIPSPGITSTLWTTYTYTWDSPANYTTLNLNPLNNNYGGPNTITWMDIDNVCIKDLGLSPIKFIVNVDFFGEAMKLRPDVVKVTFRSSTSPYSIVDVDTVISIVDSPKVSARIFTENVALGSSYFIVLNHRNSIETWSKNPVMITGDTTTNYNFTTSLSKAYGNNMVLVDGLASIYSGDVNQDGLVDIGDIVLCYNASSAFLTGYEDTDLNGDGLIDISDIVTCYNNNAGFVQVMRP